MAASSRATASFARNCVTAWSRPTSAWQLPARRTREPLPGGERPARRDHARGRTRNDASPRPAGLVYRHGTRALRTWSVPRAVQARMTSPALASRCLEAECATLCAGYGENGGRRGSTTRLGLGGAVNAVRCACGADRGDGSTSTLRRRAMAPPVLAAASARPTSPWGPSSRARGRAPLWAQPPLVIGRGDVRQVIVIGTGIRGTGSRHGRSEGGARGTAIDGGRGIDARDWSQSIGSPSPQTEEAPWRSHRRGRPGCSTRSGP